ncbi:hypothetical protein BAU28_14430 [Bacillus paramycoides]|uniref:Uncharacterized protein n=1 Tax=Bacillus paramycoides TaxID=2026194 RepID=A0A1J9UKN4_9BACI|nr:hypothetical protein BAU28_14430 [Bacillus paramycoides]
MASLYESQKILLLFSEIGKISSWVLLVVISIMIVAQLKEISYKDSTIYKGVRQRFPLFGATHKSKAREEAI